MWKDITYPKFQYRKWDTCQNIIYPCKRLAKECHFDNVFRLSFSSCSVERHWTRGSRMPPPHLHRYCLSLAWRFRRKTQNRQRILSNFANRLLISFHFAPFSFCLTHHAAPNFSAETEILLLIVQIHLYIRHSNRIQVVPLRCRKHVVQTWDCQSCQTPSSCFNVLILSSYCVGIHPSFERWNLKSNGHLAWRKITL